MFFLINYNYSFWIDRDSYIIRIKDLTLDCKAFDIYGDIICSYDVVYDGCNLNVYKIFLMIIHKHYCTKIISIKKILS